MFQDPQNKKALLFQAFHFVLHSKITETEKLIVATQL
jgi:hypothetical protein